MLAKLGCIIDELSSLFHDISFIWNTVNYNGSDIYGYVRRNVSASMYADPLFTIASYFIKLKTLREGGKIKPYKTYYEVNWTENLMANMKVNFPQLVKKSCCVVKDT
jgi:hypothetical protein